jgi:hypothetical protein
MGVPVYFGQVTVRHFTEEFYISLKLQLRYHSPKSTSQVTGPCQLEADVANWKVLRQEREAAEHQFVPFDGYKRARAYEGKGPLAVYSM